MTQIAIIPDLHADPMRLDATLATAAGLGITRFAFLGDYIDAGVTKNPADDRAVLKAVQALVSAGSAHAIMGNHELNALLYHSTVANGPLRPHSAKNTAQHESFLAQIAPQKDELTQWLGWFLTLPLWVDADGFRLVHAYWGEAEIALISQRRPDGRLRREDLPEIAAESTDFGRAVQRLVTGPDVPLPEGVSFCDYRGHLRHEVRIAWWRDDARTWRDVALSVTDPSVLPDAELPADVHLGGYPADAKAVFFGHYKRQGPPQIDRANVQCLDYPQSPCLYRFDGGIIRAENLILCDAYGGAAGGATGGSAMV